MTGMFRILYRTSFYDRPEEELIEYELHCYEQAPSDVQEAEIAKRAEE